MSAKPADRVSRPSLFDAIGRRLTLLAAATLMLGAGPAHAQVQQPILGQGNAVVTGFSGTMNSAAPPASGNPIDGLFIDLNGASARILDLQTGGQPPQGQIIASPTVLPIKAGDVGQVFGLALDDGKGPDGNLSGVPDIYLTATSTFGLQIVTVGPSGQLQRLKQGQPGAQWMPGQWGDASKGATPGSIWKVSGTNGAVSLFTNVVLNGQPNSGPGLGNIAFDAKTRQLFVSDLGSGMIHRFDMHGQDLGYYDHGTQGRVAQGLAPVPYDPANRLDITNPAFNAEDASTWHYVQKGRMVWGLKVSADRLYYATADGPQVWSIAIGADGSFGNDPQLEIDVTGTPNNNAISDVTFDGPDTIYLAQRGTARGDYSYKTFADPAKSAVLRYTRDPKTGKWRPQSEEYAVGFPPDHRNTNGGVAIDSCSTLVWTTGELLRVGSGLAGPDAVHGLQGMDKNLVRPANVPPRQSYFADYDGQFNDSDAHGHMGDVEIWHPCQGVGQLVPQQPPVVVPPLPPGGGFNLTLTKEAAPFYCPPGENCIPHPQNPQSTDCVQGGGGSWICTYRIIVRNTGSTTYAGPLTVNDWLPSAPPGATMAFSPQPPWFCAPTGPDAYQCVHPGLVLNPGDSVELDVVVDLPATYQGCYLDNAAAIDWPAGYGDANPLDDQDYAGAHIPGTNCPPPTGDRTNLKIEKFAFPKTCVTASNGGWQCSFRVRVINTGPGVYNEKIVVDDTIPAGTTAAFAAPWNCPGGPPTYACTHPALTLNPSQGVNMWMVVKVPASYVREGHCEVPNHVHIAFAPGGSPQNTNPADDDASATALIPSDLCLGKQTNLKIEKFAGPCKRAQLGYMCYYGVRVTNTGPGNFNGPIVVDDTFATPLSGTASFLPQPPWNCSGGGTNYQCIYPAASLNPGQSVVFVAVAPQNVAAAVRDKCALKNTAHISAPSGGSPQNSNPGDDTASATDTISDPNCLPTPTPGNDGHVSILKTCKPGAVGAGIICKITVTNDGGQPISSPISFGDHGQWTGNGSQMHIAYAKPDSPAVTCTGLPDNLNCTLPGSALPPNASHTVEIGLNTAPDQVRYRNCAVLLSVNGTPLTGPGHESCVEGGGEITVIKTGPAVCAAGQGCTFQVAVINSGDAPYSGPVLIGDAMLLGNTYQFDLPITVTPPFGCPTEPATLQFNCIANVSLAGHEQQMHSITVQMPAGTPAAADGLNCFFATDGSRGVPPPKVLSPLAAGQKLQPGNGPGYSCVPFKLEVLRAQTLTQPCPGDQVRIGTQCQCPPGTRAAGNFSCHGGGTRIIPLPIPIPIPTGCNDRERRMFNGECCPFGTVAFGNACRSKETPPCPDGSRPNSDGVCPKPTTNTCPPPRSMVNNECVCPRNTPFWNGQTCSRPQDNCTGGQVSNHDGGCMCPKDRPLFVNGVCSVPHVIFCRSPLVQQKDGTCGCPNPGDVFSHGRCQSPSGKGTGGVQGTCTGIMLNGVCLSKVVPHTTTPSCPKGQHWGGKACVPDAGKNILKQLNIPGLGGGIKIN